MREHQRSQEVGDEKEDHSCRRELGEGDHLRRGEVAQNIPAGRGERCEGLAIGNHAIRGAIHSVERGPRFGLTTLLFRARVSTVLQSMRERGRRRTRRAPRLPVRIRGRRRQH